MPIGAEAWHGLSREVMKRMKPISRDGSALESPHLPISVEKRGWDTKTNGQLHFSAHLLIDYLEFAASWAEAVSCLCESLTGGGNKSWIRGSLIVIKCSFGCLCLFIQSSKSDSIWLYYSLKSSHERSDVVPPVSLTAFLSAVETSNKVHLLKYCTFEPPLSEYFPFMLLYTSTPQCIVKD